MKVRAGFGFVCLLQTVCAVAGALSAAADTAAAGSAATAVAGSAAAAGEAAAEYAVDVGATAAELQRRWELQLVDALFSRAAACLSATVGRMGAATAAAAEASNVATQLLCCSFSLPVSHEQQQTLKNILMKQLQRPQTKLQQSKAKRYQLQQQQQQQQDKAANAASPLSRRRTTRLLGLVEPSLLLQLLLVQLRQQRHQLQQEQQPAMDFVFFGAACGALRRHLQELSSALHARLLA